MHYIPFNDGTLGRKEAMDIMHEFPLPDIFINRFKGSLWHMRNGAGKYVQGVH